MTGQSVGSDASPLSCFLFRPRKSCEKRRKRSHTNVSNASVTRTSTPPAQTAHAAKQGSPLPRPQHSLVLPVKLLCMPYLQPLILPRFYIHTFPGSLRTLTISNSSISDHLSSRFSTSRTNGLRLLSQAKVGTHSAFRERSHTTAHTPKEGAFRMGRYHYPRHELHVHEHPRAGYQNGVLCRFWVLVGGAPKERREPRDSDALMRVAVSRRRGPAGLRDLFTFVEVAACTPCAQSFLCVRGRGGITTLGVLCVLLKRWTAACQKGSFAVF